MKLNRNKEKKRRKKIATRDFVNAESQNTEEKKIKKVKPKPSPVVEKIEEKGLHHTTPLFHFVCLLILNICFH